ncbi:MAG: hypothetical protein RMM53_09710, partial [Bacteroidia bacterium]|nr:hypothetical protein [Bacteroidia bacterium]
VVYSFVRFRSARANALFFVVPVAIMFLKSRWSAPVLHYYGPFFAAPFLFLAMSAALRRWTAWLWAAAMAVAAVRAHDQIPWGRFRELHAAAVQWSDAALFASVNHPEYVYHYGRQKIIAANACRDSVRTWMRTAAQSPTRRAAWIHSACDEPEYPEWLRRFYPCLKEARRWNGAGAYLFEKGDCQDWIWADSMSFDPPLILDASRPFSPGWDSAQCPSGRTIALWAEATDCGGAAVLEASTWHGSKHCLDTLELVVRPSDGSQFKAYFWNPDSTPVGLRKLRLYCR